MHLLTSIFIRGMRLRGAGYKLKYMNKIGIYALWWVQEDLVYIGQSSSINRRYTEHIYKMKSGNHSNYKVQELYTKTGNIPELVILELCSLDKLNDLEVIWTNEFNSLHTGLNIVEPGIVGHGTTSNNSKYSLLQVLKVFSLLYKTKLSYAHIADKLKVDISLVNDIRRGNSHTWLQDKYPSKYFIMLSNRDSKYSDSRAYPDLISPAGVIYTNITNLSDIYTKDPILSLNISAARNGFYKLKKGLKPSYKGWKLARTAPNG